MSLKIWSALARRSLATAERGQALVEYSLIIALISIGTFAAMAFLKNQVSAVFSQVGSFL